MSGYSDFETYTELEVSLCIWVPLVQRCDHNCTRALKVHGKATHPVISISFHLSRSDVDPRAVINEIFHKVSRGTIVWSDTIDVGYIKCPFDGRKNAC